jgi:hypothetical protein
MRRTCLRVAATALALGLLPAVGSAGAVTTGNVPSASSESAERIDNLRLQRIDAGPLRGRLVVAGSLDHIGAAKSVRDVRVRMTMSVPTRGAAWREVGSKTMKYRLPARVKPQDMTLRWLLSAKQSRTVSRAGASARLSVQVRESATSGKLWSHRTAKKGLRVESLPTPPSHGPAARAAGDFLPGGFYTSNDEDLSFFLWTAEDASGAPYVGALGFTGTAAEGYYDSWSMSPLWLLQGSAPGSPGPGNGYVYMSGSTATWSYSGTVLLPNPYVSSNCNVPLSAGGTFSGSSAAVSWGPVECGGDSTFYYPAGSVSLTQRS